MSKLIDAAMAGDLAALEALLDQKVDVNYRNPGDGVC
jgi:hypothetical protein